MHRLTVDVNFIDAPEFAESRHPRDRIGRFARGMQSSAKSGMHATMALAKRSLKELTDQDHQILQNHMHRPNSPARRTLAEHVTSIGTTLPLLLKGHWHEEKHKAIHAAGALKSLATGKRPSPEQMHGLKSIGIRVVMSAGSMALFGDATGTIPHLAAKLAEEVVNHVLAEHTAAFGGGLARVGLAMTQKRKTHDALDADLSAEDYALLKSYIEEIAKAMRELDIPDARVQQLLGEEE